MLLRAGLLTADQLASALELKEETGERLGEIVVRHGWASEEAVARTLAEQLGLEFLDLTLTLRDHRAGNVLSPSVAAYLEAVPIRFLDDSTVLVAVADPCRPELAGLRDAMGYRVELAVATVADVKAALGASPAADAVSASLELKLELEATLPDAGEEAAPYAEAEWADDSSHLVSAPLARSLPAVSRDAEPEEPAAEDAWASPALEDDPGQAMADEPAPETTAADGEAGLASLSFPAAPQLAAFDHRGSDPVAPTGPEESPPANIAGVGAGPVPPEPPEHDGTSGWAQPQEQDAEAHEPVAEPEKTQEIVDEAALGHPRIRIGAMLMRAGLLTGGQLAYALEVKEETGERIGEILVRHGWVTEEAVARTLAEQLDLDFVDLALTPRDHRAEGVLSVSVARYLEAAPLCFLDESTVLVAVADPCRPELAALRDAIGYHVVLAVATVTDIKAALGPEIPEDVESAAPLAAFDDGGPDAVASTGPETSPPANIEGVGAEPVPPGPPEHDQTPAWAESREPEAAAHQPIPELAEHAQGITRETATPIPPKVGLAEPGFGPPDPGKAPVEIPCYEESRPRLGTMLLRAGLLSPEQLADALAEVEETGARLGSTVLGRGWVSEEELAATLADQHELEFIDLAATLPSISIGELLPARYARRYRAVPVRYVGEETLLVAVADPTNVLASDELRLVLGSSIRLAVATESAIDRALAWLFPEGANETDTVSTAPEPEADSGDPEADPLDVLEPARMAPAVELVNDALRRAVQGGASDIHFEPRADRLVVRIRVDGIMRELPSIPGDLKQATTARLKVMGELDIAERRLPQDGRVTIQFAGKPIDLRIAVLPTMHGEQVVIRLLHRSARPIELADLGLADDTAAELRRAITQPHGIVLTVGPTGSGKTTTLYAALGLLNEPGRSLVTIEDPVEYQLEGAGQVQIHTRAGLSFAAGLRTILRSDPDVILVGEIRDNETARIAIQSAMTGHLVLSTVHADNVASAISRLADMGVQRELLASTINCVVAQRLARRLCAACRVPFQIGRDGLIDAGADDRLLGEQDAFTVYRAAGCAQCHDGYKGRLGLYELLSLTPRLRQVVETATAEEIYLAAVKNGMRTLQADGLRLCLEGHTALEEIQRVAGEPRI
jgi:type IV pilus assembly protein PilB